MITSIVNSRMFREEYNQWIDEFQTIIAPTPEEQYKLQHLRYSDFFFIHQAMKPTVTDKILELGAWPTYGFLYFAQFAAETVISDNLQWDSERDLAGVDKSPSPWLKNCASFPKTVAEKIDACNIPYDNYFNFIYSVSVIEHVVDDNLALRQMYKALAPGGTMILTTEVNLFTSMPYQPDVYFRVYKFSEIIEQIRAAGFIVSNNIEGVDAEVEAMMSGAINHETELRQPYKHFMSGGVVCRKPL